MGKHPNTLRRIKLVCDLTQQHYEIGRRDRCYKEVWRRYVNPVYPCCYHTYLSYLRVRIGKETEESKHIQLRLFQ